MKRHGLASQAPASVQGSLFDMMMADSTAIAMAFSCILCQSASSHWRIRPFHGRQTQRTTKIELDAIDRRLLRALQENGRIPVSDLAEKVGLTASPCLRRLRILEQAGVIKGYAALLDQERVGLPVSVFVSVKLEMQREQALEHFEAAIRDCAEVVECYLMTGPRDYLLRVVARDLAAYERFLKETLTRVEGVASIESSFALAQVKYANALPLDE